MNLNSESFKLHLKIINKNNQFTNIQFQPDIFRQHNCLNCNAHLAIDSTLCSQQSFETV